MLGIAVDHSFVNQCGNKEEAELYLNKYEFTHVQLEDETIVTSKEFIENYYKTN